MPPPTRILLNQLLAISCTLAVMAFRLVLEGTGANLSPTLLYPIAAVIAALVGGFWPGLTATLLSAAAVAYHSLEPRGTLQVSDPREVVGLVLFVGQGVLIGLLGGGRLQAVRGLARTNAELEQRVSERTTELQSANLRLHQEVLQRRQAEETMRSLNQQLSSSNRELQDFAFVASHDLQEPLRKIQAFGERLEALASLDERGKDYLQRMRSSAGRMQTLINDLLTFSRVTTKAQPFTCVDLNEIVGAALEDLETRIHESKARVEVDDLPRIEADNTQMRQLIQNLLSNALKFRRADVEPLIRVFSEVPSPDEAEDRPETVRLVIQDNGIGFEEKYLDRIFGVFQRLHSRNNFEGSGIGLAVCRKIVERHGGTITARSRPGEGAAFIVTLPLRQQGAAE